MLGEALTIITSLFDGGYVNFAGDHFRVDSAKVWDLPEQRVPIGVAVSGNQSIETFAPLADHLIAVEPEAELVQQWDEAAPGSRTPQDRAAAGLLGRRPRRAPSSAPTSSSAGSVAAGRSTPSCPGPAGFAGATQFVDRGRRRLDPVRPGPRRDREAVARLRPTPASPTWRSCRSATRTQHDFLEFAEHELLPALRG